LTAYEMLRKYYFFITFHPTTTLPTESITI